MAITFPRAIPDVPYVGADLELIESVSQSRSGERLTNIVEYADPVWRVTLTTKPLRPPLAASVEAWWRSLRGGLKTVLYRHPWYCTPIGNVSSRGPELDPGTVSSVASGNVVAIASVDAGLVLSPGDYVSFAAVSGVRHLGQVSDVSGTGTSRTVTIEPPAPVGLNLVGATARFDRAELLTRPIAGSHDVSGSSTLKTITFQLLESAT
ncbi:hypothetical protein [Consotaella salsifontis]|uniref:Uncharacterized protein n=1 Tax=Consotaella salsifontis TaxID=1365950 RepID=A0A1T4SS50_9HYPH|nr:hypothetical protein [Consotaella salsifontis]SKA30993.1 hypothetical protein SAMN05428963_11397 [Consotaella salsifontis]